MDLGALSCYLSLGLKHSDAKQDTKRRKKKTIFNPIQGGGGHVSLLPLPGSTTCAGETHVI